MSGKLKKILDNQEENHIFPFFWLHGEDEKTLREYMKAIDESNIKAVCVESRPHPDYCGPKWWEDMDVIMEEARKRKMQVWVLDDSHFPTGYANGAMKGQQQKLHRQSICCRHYECRGGEHLKIEAGGLLHPDAFVPTKMEEVIAQANRRSPVPESRFDDDRLLGLYAVCTDPGRDGFIQDEYRVDLMPFIRDQELEWKVPEGNWKVYALHLTRNRGYHSDYINMMDKASCRVLIDAVYEPHWEHYREDFGTTLAGFFSDEPELGNGHLYEQGNTLGSDPGADYPWSAELEEELLERFGGNLPLYMALLWENNADTEITAKVRYGYMDAVSRLVEADFSFQIGDWCRAHGVKYIGHIIEDNNQHARTGSSLGHYFRGLAGQDMAGIDDIGGQVLPQGEGEIDSDNPFQTRDGEFFHYMLGKLASSAAAIEPLKKGNSMCEIFGAYGWGEGVRLEKYLVDHFLVRGINHFVPHAFSAKEFPDPDCPPHFYAHGHNPQYRHFGRLMAYTNRVCTLISGGRHSAPVAVLYHGEGEWTGKCMFSQRAGHVLADSQIEYDYLPQDVFAERTGYRTRIETCCLKVNTQEYKAVVVPMTQYITRAFAEAVIQMQEAQIPVFFIDAVPEGICDEPDQELADAVKESRVITLEMLADELRNSGIPEIRIYPSDDRIRYCHYLHEDGLSVYLFVNEGIKPYEGTLFLQEKANAYQYDAWENRLYYFEGAAGYTVQIEPMKSLIVVSGGSDVEYETLAEHPYALEGMKEVQLMDNWRRSVCTSITYPDFTGEKRISLPDALAEEMPAFSGFVRYETTFASEDCEEMILQIEDAHEGVEVFVNGISLGIQVAPPFLYLLSGVVKNGENQLVIEVATTLERSMGAIPNYMGVVVEPASLSGITGTVKLYQRRKEKQL